ncbi:MAG: DUF7344 domain-containing protein [Halodesulfurarchaeum sp.]
MTTTSAIHTDAGHTDTPILPARLLEERSVDDVFFALSNYRRRFVLRYLKRTTGPVSLRTLSEELAAWENEVDRSMTTAVQRKRAYVALRQTHLPKLAELGIITYDASRGFAELSEGIDELEPFLAAEHGSERRRPMVYAGAGAAASVAIWLLFRGILLL